MITNLTDVQDNSSMFDWWLSPNLLVHLELSGKKYFFRSVGIFDISRNG